MAILSALSEMLCRVQDYAAWRAGTTPFPRKFKDMVIVDAA
jgi:hypothetical protein